MSSKTDTKREVRGLAKSTERLIADKIKKRNKAGLVIGCDSTGGNEVHRKLKYHEKKLLRKHDFIQYDQDLWHEPYCISKYALHDREDYRRYLRLVGLIRQQMTQLRYLPPESLVRIEITRNIIQKLYQMGLIAHTTNLSEVDKVGVEAFCKRRISAVCVDLKLAANCRIASQFIQQGHIRCGTQQIRDPAFLVSRGLEERITWVNTSKLKKHVDIFNARYDDYDA